VLKIYSRSFDVLALMAIASICLISLVAGFLMVMLWALLSCANATRVVVVNAGTSMAVAVGLQKGEERTGGGGGGGNGSATKFKTNGGRRFRTPGK